MNPTKLRALCLAALPCVIGCSTEERQAIDTCGDIKTVASGIINGSAYWDPTVVPLTESQAEAIGFLDLGGRAGCTGTLIGPSTVLTAAHCVSFHPSYVRFRTGRDYYFPTHEYMALSYNAHPMYGGGYVEYDLAIVTLSQNPMDDGITPIPPHLAPAQSLAGEHVQAVGYGMTAAEDYTNTLKWWTVLRVSWENTDIFTVTGDYENGTCQGDSGGPLLWNDPAVGVRTHGALSSGDSEDCLGNSYYPRTDSVQNTNFINTYLPIDPCGGETLFGRCVDSGTAIYCEDSVRHEDACAPGTACQIDGDGHYRCLATDPCAGETLTGRCDGSGAAIWCESDSILLHPCPDFGYHCGPDASGRMRCLPPGPCDATGLEFVGECTPEGMARWCVDGEVFERDCAACGQACGWTGDDLGYYCFG